VHGFHSVFRVAPNGRLLIELVVQFAQQDRTQLNALGGIPLRGGTTLVASADGQVRYLIAKPLPSARLEPARRREADARVERQKGYVAMCDARDARLAYADDAYVGQRMALRMNLSALHDGAV
jgi:hypothetical protein